MEGVAEPELLVSSDSSPHQYILKPSQMFSLQRADLVVWVGESVEGFLPRALTSLGADKQVMQLMALPGMLLLPARKGGVWEEQRESHAVHQAHGHKHGDTDGHIWLDPVNARLIVQALVARLSLLDPPHADRYRANGERLQLQLAALDRELNETLAPLRGLPYLVFHDAYQYFEQRYGLTPVGAIMIDLERKPGARRLAEIRDRIQSQHVQCVFSEPQFSDKLLQVVSEGTSIKSAVLDPMGRGLKPGKALYFDLMHQLGQHLAGCLTQK